LKLIRRACQKTFQCGWFGLLDFAAAIVEAGLNVAALLGKIVNHALGQWQRTDRIAASAFRQTKSSSQRPTWGRKAVFHGGTI